jgi:hypothetical protein
MKLINKIAGLILLVFAIGGCGKNYLSRPSNSQISSNNFYKSTSDLRLATASLYGGANWWQWHTYAFIPIGDALSGNTYVGYYGDFDELFTRTITSQNSIVSYGWTGLYNVIAQCNLTINGINQYAADSIPAASINAALAETRFIRGVAYYYLALDWGAVPIIADNTKLIQQPLLNRNIVSDVYKFVTTDLTYAAQNLPVSDVAGRVNTWSAQGMLGKVYLTLAGLGQNGTRSQPLLDSAIKYAGNVCQNSGISLYPSYYDLFRAQYNNVPEDLFALQWAAGVTWGNGNQLQQYYAPSGNLVPAGQGGWNPLQPTYDLYQSYTWKDTVRRKATMMLTGDYYPELEAASGGYTAGGTGLKKHVIGTAQDNNSPAMTAQSSIEDDAMLRLSDVYLVYAEAILGNNATTTDAVALNYFNMVRQRAGVDPAPMLTIDTIMNERRIELAFEGQYWDDIVRLSYYDPAKALYILNNQNRDVFTYSNGVATLPTSPTGGTIVPATIYSFALPIPAADLASDPNLANPPVAYY